MKTQVAATAFAVATCISAASAVTIQTGNANGPEFENVLFNSSSLISTGLIVEGRLNDDPNSIIEFVSMDDQLVANGGAASIERLGGGTFDDLLIRTQDMSVGFEQLGLNIDAVADGQVEFVVTELDGDVTTGTLDLDENGQNKFVISIDSGDDLLRSVAFTTTVGVVDVKQVRVAGLTVVPEPAGLALLATGGLLALRRRR